MNYIEGLKSQLSKKSPLYIKVKVLSKMPQTEIVDQMDDGSYKIRVKAIPVKGAANEALCRFLKKALGASHVVVVSGGRDKIKLIRISG